MTWNETEKFAQHCVDSGMTDDDLKDIANKLYFFESCNFVLILQKMGRKISV